MSVSVVINGSVSANPSAGTTSFPSETRTLTFNATRTHARRFGGEVAVTGTIGSPQDLDLGGLTAVKFFAIRVTGSLVVLRISSATAALQLVEVAAGGQFIMDNPSGADITAISAYTAGSGVEAEYLVTG